MAFEARDCPVLLLWFNRPDLAARVLEGVRRAAPKRLFIAIDGPRPNHPEDKIRCFECRQLAETVDWPCTVQTLIREENLGCFKAVTSALAWFFDRVEAGVILEDDCVPEPTFFEYCAELLQKYKADKRILTIGGNNLGHPKLTASYGFTPFMNMWGWATWRDRFKAIDYASHNLGHLNAPKNRARLFWGLLRGRPSFWHLDYRWYLHWLKSFTENLEGGIHHWDLPWIYHGLVERTVSIFPAVNLVTNIGFGKVGTHTTDFQSPLAGLPTSPMTFPLVHPIGIRHSKFYEQECIRRRWSGFEPSFMQDLRTMYYYSKLWVVSRTGAARRCK